MTLRADAAAASRLECKPKSRRTPIYPIYFSFRVSDFQHRSNVLGLATGSSTTQLKINNDARIPKAVLHPSRREVCSLFVGMKRL